MYLCRNRIDLINRIEMQAKEDSQLWNQNVTNKRNTKPLHERLIEAKLSGSRSLYEDIPKKAGSKNKKYKNS